MTNNSYSTLPVFPKFSRLTANHQAAIEDAIKHAHLYSDYNFISLWSWDHQQKLRVSSLNNNLVIRFQDYINPEDYFYSFFGTNDVDATMRKLLSFSINQGRNSLKLIPEFVIDKLKKHDDLLITEDRDSFDYIVAIKDMIDLKGSESSSKRWSMNHFMSRHQHDLAIRELDIRHGQNHNDLLELVEEWAGQMRGKSSFSNSEIKALKKVLSEHKKIRSDNLHILGLYLDNNLKAFSISEILKDGFAMGHYKKASREYRGLGVALDHYTAKSLAQKGVSHLNHEQDLGIEGLRKAKLASHPVYFLKKYTVSLAKPKK